MSRLVAMVATATGRTLEGYQVMLVGTSSATTLTDASGVFRVDLEPGGYLLPLETALQVDGTPYATGTVLQLQIPDLAEEPLSLASCLTGTIDASLPALLARLVALEGEVS